MELPEGATEKERALSRLYCREGIKEDNFSIWFPSTPDYDM